MDDGKVLASEMKSGASSEEESGNPDDGTIQIDVVEGGIAIGDGTAKL